MNTVRAGKARSSMQRTSRGFCASRLHRVPGSPALTYRRPAHCSAWVGKRGRERGVVDPSLCCDDPAHRHPPAACARGLRVAPRTRARAALSDCARRAVFPTLGRSVARRFDAARRRPLQLSASGAEDRADLRNSSRARLNCRSTSHGGGRPVRKRRPCRSPLDRLPLSSSIFNLTADARARKPRRHSRPRSRRASAVPSPLVAIIDMSDFFERFGAAPQRLAERQAAWRQAIGVESVEIVFARLADPDVPTAQRARRAFRAHDRMARRRQRAPPRRRRLERHGRASRSRLSLISHTNVGKTALARTLLGRDVGEVRDEAHVTATAERYAMIETAQGDALVAVGHAGVRRQRAARAATAPRSASRSLGFLSRGLGPLARPRACGRASRRCATCATRPTSCSISSTRPKSPADAGYLAPELQILEWIGKPVIVLLNQTGPPRRAARRRPPRSRAGARALGARADHARRARARRVRALLGAGGRRCCARRARAAGREAGGVCAPRRRVARAARRAFDAAMAAIAEPIARAACDRVAAAGRRRLRSSLRRRRQGDRPCARTASIRPRRRAMRALSERLDADIRASTDRLIAHPRARRPRRRGGDGATRRQRDAPTRPCDERKAAIIGGVRLRRADRPRRRSRVGRAHVRRGTARGRPRRRASAAPGRARLQPRARQDRSRRCAGTTNSSPRWCPRRCCAISPSRITAAAAANGQRANTRRSGATLSHRGVERHGGVAAGACARRVEPCATSGALAAWQREACVRSRWRARRPSIRMPRPASRSTDGECRRDDETEDASSSTRWRCTPAPRPTRRPAPARCRST